MTTDPKAHAMPAGDAYAQALAERNLPSDAAERIAARVPLPEPDLYRDAKDYTYTADQLRAAILAGVREGMRSCAVAFADTDPEARFIEDSAHLNCPTCGGSGHVGDALVIGEAVPVAESKVSEALAYSRNYATANPLLSKTAAEHILGLCDLLEKHASTPPAPAVDEAMVGRAWIAATKACVVGGKYSPPTLPEDWERALTAALTAALHGDKA